MPRLALILTTALLGASALLPACKGKDANAEGAVAGAEVRYRL